MTATINPGPQVTMSGNEVTFARTTSLATTNLSDVDVVVAGTYSEAGPAASQRALRPSLVGPLSRLVDLGPNWDGHHAKPPSASALAQAASVLGVLQADTPDPEVLASTTGGVLLEWESEDVELLIHIWDGGTETSVTVGETTVEGPLADVLEEVGEALARLTFRS